MNVLHAVEGLSAEFGGLSRAVVGLAGALTRRRIDVEIIATRHDRQEPIPSGVLPVQTFRRNPAGMWQLSGAVRRAVAWADLVHVHGLWRSPQFFASRAAWRMDKPYLVSPHGMLDSWALRRRRFRKQLYGRLIEWETLTRSSAIHVLTEREALDVSRLGFGRPVQLIPNGLDLSEFDRLPDRATGACHFPAIAGKRVILFLGRIHPQKGLDLLVRAFHDVVHRCPETFLLIAGPDEEGYRRHVEADLKRLVPPDRFLFTGLLQGESRLAALASADIFVLPSYSEGLPMAALEAMAAGLPVILSEDCNLSSVQEIGAGLVVPTQADALCKAILYLIDAPFLAKAMGQRGAVFVRTHYAWDTVADQMIDLYERVVARSV